MSDWQAGDLAVCVRRGLIECKSARHHGDNVPALGVMRRVVGLTSETHRETGQPIFCGCVVLVFDDGTEGVSQRFRKIRPDEREACEPEFVTLLKRSKRKVTAIAAAARQSGDVQQAPSAGPQSGHEVASPNGGSHA